MVYAGICDRMPLTRKLAINIQIFAVSEVSGGLYYNRNANSGTETDVATLIFIWKPVTTSDSQEFRALFDLLQMINSCGLHIVQW